MSADAPCEDWTNAAAVQAVAAYADIDDAILALTIPAASEILFALSGRQFTGDCEYVARPCGPASAYDGPWHPLSGPRAAGCCCSMSGTKVDLGVGPVTSVTQVLVHGVVLAADAYAVRRGRWLVRTDGLGWPCCQDVDRASTETGTFAVHFVAGEAPSSSGALAALVLAGELGKAMSGGEGCRLPKRVQSFVRQGMSAVVLDPFQFLTEMRTSLYEVDLFLIATNPHKLAGEPFIASPDIRTPEVRRT